MSPWGEAAGLVTLEEFKEDQITPCTAHRGYRDRGAGLFLGSIGKGQETTDTGCSKETFS